MNLNRADLPLLASLSVLLEEANVTRAAAPSARAIRAAALRSTWRPTGARR